MFVAFFVACLAILAAASAIVGSVYLDSRRAEIERSARERLGLLAAGRAEAVAAWRDGLARQPDEIVNSDVIRLFMTEATSAATGAELPFYLLQQRGYVTTVLDDFVSRNGLAHAWLVDGGGDVLASSSQAPGLAPGQATQTMHLAGGGDRALGVLRRTDRGLLLDLHVKVGRADAGLAAAAPAAGALVMTLDPSPDLARFLQPSPWFAGAERFALIQTEPAPPAVARSADGTVRLEPQADSQAGAYSAAADVAGTSWQIRATMDGAVVLAPLEAARDTVVTVSASAFVVLFLIMLAAWLNQTRQFNEALAAEYARSARRIDEQRRLLARMNEAIGDGIGLRGPDDAYVQVNPAFARMVGRVADDIVGRTVGDIFPQPVAERIATAEALLVRREMPVALPARLSAGDTERDVDILPLPLRDADGRPERWLTVIQDRTDERQARRRRDHAHAQMIVCYMRAVELADEWLHGQGAFVQDVACLIAERLELSDRDRETVRVAAGLCQIGKLFIPRDILRKEGPLVEEEVKTLQGHVGKLLQLIDGMDFGYPVQAALAGMHERLDGSGYPAGLKGEAIGVPARVLGVAEAFCALVRPRPWRAARTPQAALTVLAVEAEKYPANVVEALRAAVSDGTVAAIMARQFG